MARPKTGPQPWFRKGRGWFLEINGRQVKLGDDKKAADREWHRVMAMPEPVESELVAGVIEGFLNWCEQNRSLGTYGWYKDHLESFCKSLKKPKEFPVDDLRPHHVLAWANAHKGWGNSMKRGAITAVQRAFNWAEKLQHIDRNPIRHVEGKPPAQRRETYLTTKEYHAILSHYDEGDCFRDLLEFTWESGARPQEAKEIEARHFVRQRIEIPPEEAKGKKRWRIINLTDRALEIVERLAEENPKGTLFRNEDGKPWTKSATNCRLKRLRDKIGYKISIYTIRHSFCQRMLESGLDTTVVAGLMGHSNSVMVSSVYSHMNKAQKFLAEQLRRVS